MTDNELRGNIKKIIILAVIILVVIGFLAKYLFVSKKADLSIYANSDEITSLQAIGMKEEEIKKYLSIFGNLVDTEYEENVQILNTAVNYMEDMYGSYEEITNEQGQKTFDADIINAISEEIQGNYIKKSLADGENYGYNEEQNIYIQKIASDRIPYCTKIEDVSQKGNEIMIKYSLVFLTNEQMAEYSTGKEVNLDEQDVKIILLENEEAEYSKYFVSSIEKE